MSEPARLGEALFKLFFSVGVLVVICVVAILWYRAHRRRRAEVKELERRYNFGASKRARDTDR